MKFFKNTIAVLALFCIGSIHAKQVGKKETVTAPITTPTQKISQPKPSFTKTSEGKQQLQPGTFRELLAELRNMKTNDVFTPDRSQFTDKIVQLFARIKISNLDNREIDALKIALLSLHVVETIIPINTIDTKDVELEKKVELTVKSLLTDLENRVENVTKKQFMSEAKEKESLQEYSYQPKEKALPKTPTYKPSVTKEKKQNEKSELEKVREERVWSENKITGCINSILTQYNKRNDENALQYILNSQEYNFDKIKLVFNNIIAQIKKCSTDQKAIHTKLIEILNENYYFKDLSLNERDQIIEYIKEQFKSL